MTNTNVSLVIDDIKSHLTYLGHNFNISHSHPNIIKIEVSSTDLRTFPYKSGDTVEGFVVRVSKK